MGRTRPAAAREPIDPVNEVRLRGRVSAPATERVLPSGDVVVVVRLVVPRHPPQPSSRATVDVVDCAIWRADLRRRALRWGEGQTVEVVGALRRRFWRAGSAVASRHEVEVTAAHRA